MKTPEEVVRACLVSPEGNALLVTRGDEDTRARQIELPGGHRDPGDTDWLATLGRETLEEASFNFNPDCLINAGDPFKVEKRSRTGKLIKTRIFYLGLLDDQPDVEPGEDQSDAFWKPFDELPYLLDQEAQLQAAEFFARKPELQLFLGKAAFESRKSA